MRDGYSEGQSCPVAAGPPQEPPKSPGLCILLVRHWDQNSPPAMGKVQRQLDPLLLGSQMRTVPSAEQDARRWEVGLKARPHTASPWPSRTWLSTLGSGQARRKQTVRDTSYTK